MSRYGGWKAQRSSSGARATSLEAAVAPIHHRRESACSLDVGLVPAALQRVVGLTSRLDCTLAPSTAEGTVQAGRAADGLPRRHRCGIDVMPLQDSVCACGCCDPLEALPRATFVDYLRRGLHLKISPEIGSVVTLTTARPLTSACECSVTPEPQDPQADPNFALLQRTSIGNVKLHFYRTLIVRLGKKSSRSYSFSCCWS